MGSRIRENPPLVSRFRDRENPVSRFRAVTVPAIWPCPSFGETIPRMLPVVVWAEATMAQAMAVSVRMENFRFINRS